ncbi:MAG: DUF1003 domain-containing protein [Acidobacteria bacterium]|nr:DUF1003 domain-containing protein [Acidobacteriota bacterium]
MAGERDHRGTGRRHGNAPRGADGSPVSAVEENVEAVKTWERAALLARSTGEQIGDWISRAAASGQGLLLHALWFVVWISINVGAIPGVAPFDPVPFPFLTLTVSLEAIFLSLFVLASQNRMARQADQRGHLDLQINLLTEREMTAVLQLLQDIVRHLKVETSVTAEELRDLVNKTDVPGLAMRVEELAEPSSESTQDADR